MKHNDILEDLYFGNIRPSERTFNKNSAYGRAIRRMDKSEVYLNSILRGKPREALDRLLAAHLELISITELESFIDGFRLGAKLMQAVEDENTGDLRSIE